MILLVTPNERARECAAALHEATREEVTIAESLAQATTRLRAESYLAVVLDQHLLETEPDEASPLMEHLGAALPLQVNLAITSMDRLVREVRAAIHRSHCEVVRAKRDALAQLHSELSGTVTALLLSTKLALEIAGLPEAASDKLQSVYELVTQLRNRLAASPEKPEKKVEIAVAARAIQG
jgi:hypothetical protein